MFISGNQSLIRNIDFQSIKYTLIFSTYLSSFVCRKRKHRFFSCQVPDTFLWFFVCLCGGFCVSFCVFLLLWWFIVIFPNRTWEKSTKIVQSVKFNEKYSEIHLMKREHVNDTKKSQNSHEWLLKDPSIIHFFSYIVCFDYSTCKQNHTSQTNISFSHSKYSRKKNTRLKIPLMLFATLLINHYAKHVRRCNTKRR